MRVAGVILSRRVFRKTSRHMWHRTGQPCGFRWRFSSSSTDQNDAHIGGIFCFLGGRAQQHEDFLVVFQAERYRFSGILRSMALRPYDVPLVKHGSLLGSAVSGCISSTYGGELSMVMAIKSGHKKWP